MNRQFRLIIVISMLIFNHESFGQKKSKADKTAAYNEVKEHVASGKYEFKGDFAYPQKGGQVSLDSRPNYLRVDGKTAAADLPYFGALTGGAGTYGSGGGGIMFESEITNLDVVENDKKRRIIVSGKAKAGTESYSFSLTINSKNSASLVISSMNRQTIRYRGKITSLHD